MSCLVAGLQEARVYSEEVELEMRNPAQDYTLYKQTCEMLTRLMAEIHELKSSSSSKDSATEMEERRMQSCIHFMTLKKLNRVAHMRLKKGRDQTHEAKQRVDALHLQLQNLLYEVMHLQKEINKCLEFKSKHEEIELVSVEEFTRDAPPEISRPEISAEDPHQLTLCRLDWELEQRKRLAEKYKESLASKEKIMKGIEIKKEYLSSLQPRLTEIMQASRPVQDYLSMPFEQTQKQNEVARHLPPPLYVLLVQANAYGQACDKKLSVSIIGDVNEAKALSKPPEDSQDDESDSDAEEEQNTKRRRPTLGVQLDDKRKEMLKRHPLSVNADLQCKASPTLLSLQASRPVQDYLSMPFEQTQKQNEVARHLPPPLYVLLVQANAYGQACDKKLSVSIIGDVNEAKALSKPPEDSQVLEWRAPFYCLGAESLYYDESDSDAEEEQNTKRRRPTLGVQLDDKRKEMLKRHPLSVNADLQCKATGSVTSLLLRMVEEDGSVLHLFFYYLMNLDIMTVKVKVTTGTELSGAISAGELLSPESLLNCLYPGDQGTETPNPANRYQFDKVGILMFGDYVAELGHPYTWVQNLGGLRFPTGRPEVTLLGRLTYSQHIAWGPCLLKSRLESRLALHKQFASLEHSILPVSNECQSLFPAKVVSRLIKWSTITYEEYAELPYTQQVLEAGLVQETDLLFTAVIERGTAKLQAAVVLNPRYSTVPPLFSLSLSWKGERSGRTDDNLRAMEAEVNVYHRELRGPHPGYQLLTNQLQRLCMCLDVFLETESQDESVEGPREFPREKMCLRTVRSVMSCVS
ncbi:THOC5 protein, partial [Polyodon spathula]|nr:THOC5 protein [Polyodon spathula]